MLIGGQYLLIYEITQNYRFELKGKVRISSVYYGYIFQNGREYLLTPSVAFMALLDITNLEKIKIIRSFP